ncbi:MAG: polysaccharide biosynthesis tyrosine autokinase [Bacteroidales bacterium]|jgi:capsular exopolysaccharide synthesis family protein|nr:polysaccharide biosynthesis tyrosine autokinase [Bacteroidales bacterium]MCI2135242.1 polysaccharide biosynthesis tyrosine autokinase [Bacteroidales bacterium]
MIKMSDQQDMSPDKSASVGGFNINPIDILMYLLSKWYWFLLGIAVFGGYAWYQYAKTPFVYSRSATVMIKDPSSNNIGRGLDRVNTVMVTNVANEILQFRSHKLMRDVVNRLDANVNYVVMDKLREKELYSLAPVKISFPDAEDHNTFELIATSVDKNHVRLSDFSRGPAKSIVIALGDTVSTPVGRLVAAPTLYYSEEWYGKPVTIRRKSTDSMASLFRNNLRINQIEDNSSILSLSLSDYSAIRCEDVLNMLITIYNEETIKDKNQIAINTSNFINERLVIIEKELGGVETELQDYKKDNNMIDISSAASMSISDKKEYNSASQELEMQLRMARYIKDYLVDPAKATELIPSNTGISDINIETQIAAYNANKLKRDKLIEDSSDRNPIVQELNKNLVAMRQNIIRAIDNMIVSIEVKLKESRSRANEAQWRVSNIPKQQRQMLSIERQQRIKEELYLYLLNKREENALSQATTESDARVLDPAGGSDSPISPNGKNMVTAGVMKGLALPAVIFLLIMFFDTRIRNRKDIENIVSIPFLGEIPKDSSGKSKNNDIKDIVVRAKSRDIVSEAFRIIRTNMGYMNVKSKDLKVVTFSSFGPGAGKTYVSSNLAASFALTSKKVILIDMDIRKGTLTSHERHHQHEMGLTSYLSGHATIDQIIKHDDLCENLDFIPAGPIAPNPSELLLSEQLDIMINEFRNRYDYIFIDNVPIGLVADAVITNRIADLTIFVVRVGKLDRRMLPELEKVYRSGQLKNMSLVLNGSITKSGRYGYGGYGYGYGYGYESEDGQRHKSFFKKVFGKKKS